jgi:hypothetical protein
VFRIRYKYYKYIVILFNLYNILALFIRIINEILKLFLNKFYIYYLNDIIIYLKDVKEHILYVT